MNRLAHRISRRRIVSIGAAVLLASATFRADARADAVRDGTGPLRRPWPAGRATPRLAFARHDGGRWSLADAGGRVVLLNFWASWCEPCRTEMPALELFARRHERDDVLVMAVNHRETDAAIRRFIDEMPVSLPILRDSDGAAARDWGVRVFPTTVIVGRDGLARFSMVGEADWLAPEFRDLLAPLLAQRTGS